MKKAVVMTAFFLCVQLTKRSVQLLKSGIEFY